MEKVLTLQEFIDAQTKKLFEFQHYFLEMQKVDSIEFPTESTESKWEKEFTLFSITE
jgi:hypothetical protein